MSGISQATPSQEVVPARGPALASRLAGAGLVPLAGTCAALILYQTVLKKLMPAVPRVPGPVLDWVVCGVIVLLGGLAVGIRARQVAKGVSDPLRGLVEGLEGGDLAAHLPEHGSAGGDLEALYDRLRHQIQRLSGAAHDPGPAAAGDAVKTDEVVERMAALFAKLAETINELGRDVSRAATGHESAYLGLLETVAALREIRQGLTATAREAEMLAAGSGPEPVRAQRVAEMVARLGTGLDVALASLGEVSGRLEAEASGSRRLVGRGRSLAEDVRGVGQQVERAGRSSETLR